MKQIPLTQRKFALVDDEDFEFLNQWKWYALKRNNGIWYAVRKDHQKMISMHSVICPNILGSGTDHKDRDGLNNQRKNLRVCTKSQNKLNSKKPSNNTSGYKGVRKSGNKWIARLIKDGKTILSKSFDDPLLASIEYERIAKRFFGDFVYTDKEN